jgi:hypothetical protein
MPASIPKTTRVIINANPPVGELKPDTFKVEERPLPELQEGAGVGERAGAAQLARHVH